MLAKADAIGWSEDVCVIPPLSRETRDFSGDLGDDTWITAPVTALDDAEPTGVDAETA